MKWTALSLFIFCFTPTHAQEAKENWDTYLVPFAKGNGSVLVNLGLKEKAPAADLKFVVITGVKIKECTPDGFAAEKEFQTLYKISDGVAEMIEKKKRNLAAGTVTYNCERLDYFYVNDTTLLRKYLNDYYKTFYPQYSYIIRIQEDKGWDKYLNVLYPNGETLESMKNQKVLLQLTKAGDKLTKERPIYHTIQFTTEEDRRQFFAWAYEQNFKVEKDGLRTDTSTHPFILKMYREDKPDLTTMNRLTLYLSKEAARFNGIYSSWETFVIKD